VKSNTGEALMYGMVYDDENTPLQGVEILIDGKIVSVSDVQGRFILISNKRDTFEIGLQKTGFEFIQDIFQFEPFDVLHFKMLNASQLLARAEIAMDEKRLADVVTYCSRSILLDNMKYDAMYLQAIALVKLSNFGEARTVLQTLEKHIGERDYITTLLRDSTDGSQ
jgi:predicted nucleotidyltransferase